MNQMTMITHCHLQKDCGEMNETMDSWIRMVKIIVTIETLWQVWWWWWWWWWWMLYDEYFKDTSIAQYLVKFHKGSAVSYSKIFTHFPVCQGFPYTVAERFCFDQARSSTIFAGLVPYVAVPLIQYISFVDPFINVTNPLHCQLQQQASDRHPRRHGEEMSTRLFESDRFTVQNEFACWMVLVEPLKIHMYWL